MKKTEKSKKYDEELNKKRGARLQKCRKMRKVTQQILANEVGYEHSNTISQLESGARPITWDKIIPIAEYLDVNPAFIMCESDYIMGGRLSANSHDYADDTDRNFLYLVMSLGFVLKFHIVPLRNERKEHVRLLNQIPGFSVRDPQCVFCDDNGTHEGVITSVSINDIRVSYGVFVYIINDIYEYIKHVFNRANCTENDIKTTDTINMIVRSTANSTVQNPYYEIMRDDEKMDYYRKNILPDMM